MFTAYVQGLDIISRRKSRFLSKLTAAEEWQRRKTLNPSGKMKLSIHQLKHILQDSLYRLANDPSKYLLINLEDLWLETMPQNVPNSGKTYPNWQKKFKFSFEKWTKNKFLCTTIYNISLIRKEIGSMSNHSLMTKEDIYLFNEGTHSRLYQILGSHPAFDEHKKPGFNFAVWAPNASQVYLIGDFNGWNKKSHPLHPEDSSGIWCGFFGNIAIGQCYKYYIVSNQGNYTCEKADPFGFYFETPPCTATKVWVNNFSWNDDVWMNSRGFRQSHQKPLSIYELHLGSWLRIGKGITVP